MTECPYLKIFLKIALAFLLTSKVYSSSGDEIATLSDGSCWYENKESLQVTSYNDLGIYKGSKDQIEADFKKLIVDNLQTPRPLRIHDLDLSLHCGGYGASLVAKVTTEDKSICLWAKLEKGSLSLRSIGVLGIEEAPESSLCDGHKWGEFIIGVNSLELVLELESSKWSTMVEKVTLISNKTYKVILAKDFEFKEQVVIDRIKENFQGLNFIRYIEYNEYRHPVGEFVHLK